MANWSRNQYRGNLGELEVARQFLHMGCAVNSLTASDAGWDLHIQIPEAAQLYKALPETWPLSGRTVHVQVKYTSSKSIAVYLDTLRGWVVGSKIGVPTFLVVLFESDSALTFKFAPPWKLEEKCESKPNHRAADEAEAQEPELAAEEPSETVEDEVLVPDFPGDSPKTEVKKKKVRPTRTFSAASTLDWDTDKFGRLLQLWSKYPGFMFKAKIDTWTFDGLAIRRAEFLVAKICWAWAWAHREPSSTDDDALNKMLYIALPAAKILQPDSIDNLPMAECLMEHIRDGQRALIEHLEQKRDAAAALNDVREAQLIQTQIDRNPWPQIDFATTYATSTGEGQAFNEALALAADIVEYARYLAPKE